MDLTFTLRQWEILKKLTAVEDWCDFVGYQVNGSVRVGKVDLKGEDYGVITWSDEEDIVRVHLPDAN